MTVLRWTTAQGTAARHLPRPLQMAKAALLSCRSGRPWQDQPLIESSNCVRVGKNRFHIAKCRSLGPWYVTSTSWMLGMCLSYSNSPLALSWMCTCLKLCAFPRVFGIHRSPSAFSASFLRASRSKQVCGGVVPGVYFIHTFESRPVSHKSESTVPGRPPFILLSAPESGGI